MIPDLHPNGVWALQALADVRELPAILALRPYLPQSEPPTLTSPVAVQLREAGLLTAVISAGQSFGGDLEAVRPEQIAEAEDDHDAG